MVALFSFWKFVTQTKTNWQEYGVKRLSVGLGDLLEGLLSPTIGRHGEEIVESILTAKGYETYLSPQSQTPADVWGIRRYRPFTHIALIQVKATKTGIPYELNAGEKEILKEFCAFVKDEWNSNSEIPAKEKEQPLIVSVGYAGVVFTGRGYTNYSLYQCGQICTRTKGIPADVKTDAEDKVRIVHLLRTRSV